VTRSSETSTLYSYAGCGRSTRAVAYRLVDIVAIVIVFLVMVSFIACQQTSHIVNRCRELHFKLVWAPSSSSFSFAYVFDNIGSQGILPSPAPQAAPSTGPAIAKGPVLLTHDSE